MNKIRYYAGIGSRETPTELMEDIKIICYRLNDLKYTLRSGGALGADSYFEKYAFNKEIFLPWKGYCQKYGKDFRVPKLTQEMYEIAEKYHPNWSACSDGIKAMHTRNVCQILGEDLKTPVDFVICWTKDGKASGGTGQALRIAKGYGIQIFNLKNKEDLDRLQLFLNIEL